MWPWRVKMPTQNLLRLLLLLVLMLSIMLATVCYWFGSWRLVLKLNFCSEFEHKGWSRFWSWSLFSILPLMFCRGYELESWSRFCNYVWSRFWSLSAMERLMFGWDFEVEIWSRIVFEFVIWNQHSGPLCLWQCFEQIIGESGTVNGQVVINIPIYIDPGVDNQRGRRCVGNQSLIVTRALEGSVVLVLATVICGSTAEKKWKCEYFVWLWLQKKTAAWCMADGPP